MYFLISVIMCYMYMTHVRTDVCINIVYVLSDGGQLKIANSIDVINSLYIAFILHQNKTFKTIHMNADISHCLSLKVSRK